MAHWGRAHVIKAAFLVGILLVLFFYSYHPESKTESNSQMIRLKTSQQWPKRTRSSYEIANFSNSIESINSTITNRVLTSFNVTSHNATTLPQINFNITTNASTALATNFSIKVPLDDRKNILNITKINNDDDDDDALIIAQHNASRHLINPPKIISEAAGVIMRRRNGTTSTPKSHHNNSTLIIETTTKPTLFQSIMTTLGLNLCPEMSPNLEGPINVNTSHQRLSVLEHHFAPLLLPGGWYKPKECNARDRVALIIPYRDRAQHLPIFLANIHPFLMKQQIEYGIFLIEQIADGLFNRAALMNIGYVEALKLNDWDCFIFHDIDLLPMDDRNLYTCPDQPRHMSVAVDTMGFKLPYSSIFGGVSALTTQQFKTVNGFSNSFWGWGGEDDDMSNRLKHFGFHIARYPVNIARYTMLSHKKEKANPKRYEKLVNGAKRYNVEGLNSLKYKIHYLERKILYTWVLVEVKQESL